MKPRSRWRLALLLLLLTTPFAFAQSSDIRITRLEISSPWTGFYYEGQGAQIWGKAVVQNSSNIPLREATIRFEFFDTVGSRETFDKPLPAVQPGGVVVIESPQWLDYSGAKLGMKATVIQNKKPLAQKRLEIPK